MALLETRLKHKSYFIELCGFGPWQQNLKLHKWLCLSRLRQKNSFIELCGFLAQANHAPKKVARFTASAAALLGRHCRKKVRNCVKTLEITASFFKVCNLTQQLSPPKSSPRGHSQNNSNKFTFSHFLFYYCFVHPIFGFWSLLAMKLQKYYIIFVYILQGKMGKTGKNGKIITQLK